MPRHENSALQKVTTFDTLGTFASGSGNIDDVEFQVPIPDSRLRVKISLLFIPTSGTATSGASGEVWMREAERDSSGVSGSLIPCANINVGTEAAPLAIPVAAGLQGYSREFVTAADYILGTASFTGGGPTTGGSWVLQCRYQPQAVRFTDDEWNRIASNCNPVVSSGPINA